MRIATFTTLVLLSIIGASCATSPDFDVKTVDAVSGKSISGVKVDLSTTHYTGRKSFDIEKSILGKTDVQGLVNVGRLNNYSRGHSLSFVKAGYNKMSLFVRELDGKHFCIIINSHGDHIGYVRITESGVVKTSDIADIEFIGNSVTHSEAMVVKIPMRRK